MTAFARAGSVKPVRKTVWKFWNASPSIILKTGSDAFLALPLSLKVKNKLTSLVADKYLLSYNNICNRELSTGSVSNGSIALADKDESNAGHFIDRGSLITALRSSFKRVTRKFCLDSCSSNRFALRACLTACDLAVRFASRFCLLQGPLIGTNLNSLADSV